MPSPALCPSASHSRASLDDVTSALEKSFGVAIIKRGNQWQLRVERKNLVTQLKHVDAALSVLGKLNGGSSYTKPRHTRSAAARRKISLAQKARWAKRPSSNGQVVGVKPNRTMSPAARKKIEAFQRTRWGKVRQQKKAAQEFHAMWARCKMPNHIHAPTTIQRNGQGLILMWISGPLFSKLTFCSDVFIRLQPP
jgi:hypothetical protein